MPGMKDRGRRLGVWLRGLNRTHVLLLLILLSSCANHSKQSDILDELHTIDGSLTDVQNEVRSGDEDVVNELDSLKNILEQIASNQ